MKTLWHIFKKDFTHLRLALLLWVLLVGSAGVCDQLLLSPAAVDSEWFERTRLCASLLSFITLAVAYLMMASLVLEDPTVGTQMFWATRPISGSRLLGAKLLGVVLLFGALPILVRLPWWLYCGYGWPEVGAAALQSLTILGLLTIPAVVLATLSGQSSRFLLFSLLLLVSIPIGGALLAARATAPASSELIQQRLPLSILVFALGGIVAAAWQFVTRRLVQAVAILAAGAGLAVACLLLSPWRLDQFRPKDKTQLSGTEAISAEILDAEIFSSKNGSGHENTQVSLTLRLKNVPATEVLLSGVADIELRWPDGFVVRQQHLNARSIMDVEPRAVRQILALPQGHPDPETAKKWAELVAKTQAELLAEPQRNRPPVARQNNRRLHVGVANGVDLGFVWTVTPAVATRIKAEPPACSISTRLGVGRAEVAFEMPLEAGAHRSGKGVRLQVMNLEDLPPKDGPADPLLKKFMLTLVSATASSTNAKIYRVDRARGLYGWIANRTPFYSVLPTGTKIERIGDPLSISRVWRTDQWVDDPDWLSRQTLAVVTFRKAGGFNRDLHVDRLPLQSDTTP